MLSKWVPHFTITFLCLSDNFPSQMFCWCFSHTLYHVILLIERGGLLNKILSCKPAQVILIHRFHKKRLTDVKY